MQVTVCELPNAREAFASAWDDLIAFCQQTQSELVLLPELPFSSWFAQTPQFDLAIWDRAQQEHTRMMQSLSRLAPAIVLGTHPVTEAGQHLNRAFCWTTTTGLVGVHDKYYLPNEAGFYERCWFDRQQRDFTPLHVQDATIGFLVCSEVMFTEWARHYGKLGTTLIATPRASLDHPRWEIALRMAAIVSGAFVISSNRVDGQQFGGRGMMIGPDGEVLASTSRQTPFVTVQLDLAESILAKERYPRDVVE